jgi:hypothetical protein
MWSGARRGGQADQAEVGLMAAVQAQASRFCGRCGAPLAPGAPYCGRCGTPVVAQSVAAQPMYRYPQVPPAAYPRARQGKLTPVWIAGGLVLILLAVAIAVGGFAVSQFNNSTRPTCTQDCGPKFVTPLPEESSFRSSAFKYTVNYRSNWTVRAQDAGGVTLGTKVGSVTVTGMRGGNPDDALRSTVAALPSTKWQNVTMVTYLKGAHLGDQDGSGAVYSADLLGASQTAAKVRFAVIAASRGGVTVVVFAVDPADPKSSANGIPEGQQFDYMCTEFVWG